jgi:pyruvate/2-oxoglutarate dehydrogenase complex dihydrolipoamide dehydrogenase (E3) component
MRADLIVIGAGSGGLSVAAGAAQLGAKVVLIEGHRMGGDCLNYGCVPSKALLAAGKDGADWTTAMDRVQAAIAAIAPHDSEERFTGLGVTVIRGWARFTGPAEVAVGDQRITARRIVIATGSRPVTPPIPGLAETPHLTNETVFDQPDRPAHLLILGGGPIGIEMAQAHRHLGAEVTVVEGAPRILPRSDPDLATLLAERLMAEGIGLRTGLKVDRIEGQEGAITLHTAAGPITGSRLLVAAGRAPALDRLDLARGGVAFTPKGITVRRDLRATTNPRVYAVGDAAGGPMFTHVAGFQAGIVVRRVLFALPARADRATIPAATYTDPELAEVGLTEDQARARHGAALTVIRQDMAGNDRAQAERATIGALKLFVVKGRPVGAAILAPGAGEMIAFWALAIAQGTRLSAIAGLILPYPTRAEIGKRAVSAYFSPRLFGSPWVKRWVAAVQRWWP